MPTAFDLIGHKLKAFFKWAERERPSPSCKNEGLFEYVLVSPTPSPPSTPVLVGLVLGTPHAKRSASVQPQKSKRNVVKAIQRTRSEPTTQTRSQKPSPATTVQRNYSEPVTQPRSRAQEPIPNHLNVRYNEATAPIISPPGNDYGQGPYKVAQDLPMTYGNRNKPLPALPNDMQVNLQPEGISFFASAHDLTIPSLNIQNIHNTNASKTVFDLLAPHVSHGASHDSDERFTAPKCDPHTRIAVQEEIVGWIRDGHRDAQPKDIMWLSGPAGSGKTAIAGSVAETCKKQGLLAASFFLSSFSGSADRRSKRRIVATLAHQLAGHPCLQDYKAIVQKALELNPNIFRKNLKEQADRLLLGPLRFIQGRCDPQTWPTGILVDGLDEVEADQIQDLTKQETNRADEDDQLEILDVLYTLANDPAFPFRILVASRPERAIEEFFNTTAEGVTISLFLDAKYDPDADIERFLKSKFNAIRRQFAMTDPLWPGQKVVDRIVDISSGQFIVPTTIVRYIRSGLPQQQLHNIMQLEGVGAGAENPFAVLDALYLHILNRSPNPRLAVKWIQCIVSCGRTGSPTPALFWRQFMEDVEGQFNYLLGPLSSLISVPPLDNHTSPVTIHHKSLNDFWSTRIRCGDLYVDRATSNAFAGAKCVDVLKNKGPTVSLPSRYGLRQFMTEFLSLASLLRPSMPANLVPHSEPVCKHFAQFMGYLSHESMTELALCDVAWWTRLLLAEPSSGVRISSPVALRVLAGIYCGIHVNLCESRENNPECHPACTHWRSGILAEAKARDWCCHRLEAVPIERLAEITREGFEEKFKKMRSQFRGSILNCSICRPNWNDDVDDSGLDREDEENASQKGYSSSDNEGSGCDFSDTPNSPGTSEDEHRREAIDNDSGIVFR